MLLKNTLAAVLLVGAAAIAAPSTPNTLSKRSVDFSWGSQKVRGVNIGGWLVLEPFITPSIFQALDQSLGIVDEYTLTNKLGTTAAYNILKPHWDSWVTFADFQKIADAGFNTVRIPIGYWAYASLENGETYTPGAAPYIDAAIDWARGTGLKIWIDLHGAPGSQNGFDNSGQRMDKPTWQSGDSVAQTLSVLETISNKYAQAQYQDVVVAIELLNEPLSSELDFDDLKEFYRNGYDQVRAVSNTPVVIQDGFVSPKTYNGFLSTSDNAQNVVVDHHEYQVFTDDFVALQNWQHRQLVCNNVASYASGSDKWVIVGEWTAAETDCAPALNGYNIGSRYDGTYPNSTYVGSCADKNNIANWDDTMKGDVKGYIEAQISAFESHTQGWVFWNFKTEAAHEWDAFALLDAGIFPQPLTNQDFGSICS
ncbi:Glucan 1,3-beta-glucosidase [Lachnellula hyalina]|uniref:glucan 1,3-beta-glucosidase n=1 Tax=Lachnellula hyalina TaxID=1316788 RepID=A0A8H8R317_9HELO|nr:Glucan 1,3-beta-glucosidase [Lachnellula hyalina]TVY26751.1 Glucan 1,3-beta-glucosidase [Lachnellula hyalina]